MVAHWWTFLLIPQVFWGWGGRREEKEFIYCGNHFTGFTFDYITWEKTHNSWLAVVKPKTTVWLRWYTTIVLGSICCMDTFKGSCCTFVVPFNNVYDSLAWWSRMCLAEMCSFNRLPLTHLFSGLHAANGERLGTNNWEKNYAHESDVKLHIWTKS